MTVQPTTYVIPRIGWGARLRAVREDIAHLDQREFAESIGMSHGTYGGHEKRMEPPRGARLVANSVELRWRVPAAWLLSGDSGPTHGTAAQAVGPDGGPSVAGAGFEPATSGIRAQLAQVIDLDNRRALRVAS